MDSRHHRGGYTVSDLSEREFRHSRNGTQAGLYHTASNHRHSIKDRYMAVFRDWRSVACHGPITIETHEPNGPNGFHLKPIADAQQPNAQSGALVGASSATVSRDFARRPIVDMDSSGAARIIQLRQVIYIRH